MDIHIRECRIAYIVLETYDELIPSNAPYGFLSTPTSYQAAFTQACQGNPKWTLPKDPAHFWQYYLGARNIQVTKPMTARGKLVPVFFPSLFEIKILPNLPVRVSCAGYGWPHCIGIIIFLTVKKDLILKDFVDLAMMLRYDQNYIIDTSPPLKIEQAANQALDYLRGTFMGKNAVPGGMESPFTIVTFIDGSGPDLLNGITLNSELHKALEGLCNWNRLWLNMRKMKSTSTIQPMQFNNPTHYLFHSDRGRVTWLPGYFDLEKIRVAGCYHSNLCLLTAQIESLAALTRLVEKKITADEIISNSLSEYSRNAAINLSLLYGGTRDTYRSASALEQIKQNGYLASINAVRQHSGIGNSI